MTQAAKAREPLGSGFFWRAAGSESRAAQQGFGETRPPFFQAAVAKPPQPKFDRHRPPRESTIDPQNQPCKLPATEMCAYDSACGGGLGGNGRSLSTAADTQG